MVRHKRPPGSFKRKRVSLSTGSGKQRRQSTLVWSQSSGKKTLSEPPQGLFPVGTPVRKYFASVILENGERSRAGWYLGKVTTVMEDVALYSIRYDDGDQEDMDHKEVWQAHGNYQTHVVEKKDSRRTSPSRAARTITSCLATEEEDHDDEIVPMETSTISESPSPSETRGSASKSSKKRPRTGKAQESEDEQDEWTDDDDDKEEEEEEDNMEISQEGSRRRKRKSSSRATQKVLSFSESQPTNEEEETPTKSQDEDVDAPRSSRRRSRKVVRYNEESEDEEKDKDEGVEGNDEEEYEWNEDKNEAEDDDDDDDVLDYEDEEEEEEEQKPKRKRNTISSRPKKGSTPKKGTTQKKPPKTDPTPQAPTSWKLPASATNWTKTSVYDYDGEIPSDAEEEILRAAESSEVPVLVSRHSKEVEDDRKGGVKGSSKTGDLRLWGKQPEKPLYTAGLDLPVLSHPQQMFDDMIHHLISLDDPFRDPDKKKDAKPVSLDNKSKQEQGARKILLPMLQALHDRPLKVATMCSGTESPILALDMLQKSLEDVCVEFGLHQDLKVDTESSDASLLVFPIEHVFSCEIEPFKQAYIERNFRPPLLFRDIRELGKEEAYTAYGALAKVPNSLGCVDVLIAGTSCVDYSNLNNKKKKIDEKGESGQTFYGMVNWIKKAQPPIVIIENVSGAPWEEKVKIFQDLGYIATFRRIDTKDYYIPHTRMRGYLFAVKQPKKPSISGFFTGKKSNDQDATSRWLNGLSNLRRPASASLDAFMLPNDDARVLRGRAKLTTESCDSDAMEGDRAGRTDWTRCETRHQFARSSEELGDKRPLTGWSDSANTVMPAFAWNEWTNAQVHRIHDLMDINALRLAKAGIDSTYKTMVWNLSQNVDRDTMGKLGLCQCLTPTGVPYVTNRGGPLVGEELLLLQGIPADDLLFTKESEANLKDLAGNAMSTTVVGAVTLCALLQGYNELGSKNGKSSMGSVEGKLSDYQSLVPRPLQLPNTDIAIERVFGKYEEEIMDLGPAKVEDWKQLLEDAHWSSRLCFSEGENETLPPESLVVCRECGETCSRDHAFPPRRYEEHDFVPLTRSLDQPRKQPTLFRPELSRYLPMLVAVAGINVDKVTKPNGINESFWNEWTEKVGESIVEPDGTLCTFRFARLERSRVWTAHYVSDSSKARIEVRFHGTDQSGVTWFLFTKTPLVQGPLRTWLQKPVARLVVSPPDGGKAGFLSQGSWELCLPTSNKLNLFIRGTGEIVPSWRSRLGLKAQYETESQFSKLEISVVPESESDQALEDKISGTYRLLPKCGGACGSLMKKEGHCSPPVFLFIESGRKSLAASDHYVIAHTCHRTSHDEYRDHILHINPDFTPLFNMNDHSEYENTAHASTPGVWVKALDSCLCTKERKGWSTTSLVSKPIGDPSGKVKLSMEGWRSCAEIITCTVPVSKVNKMLSPCLRHDCLELNMTKSKGVLESLAFLTSRLSIPDALNQKQSDSGWITLDRSSLEQTDGDDALCSRCSPERPFTQWTIVEKGKQRLYLPVEDGRQAAVFERMLKERPNPWSARLSESTSPELRTLSIGCNVFSLVQRAYGCFPRNSLVRKSSRDFSPDSDIEYNFRIVPHVDQAKIRFETLTFTSNKSDDEALQPPKFIKYPLRREQLRSLKWMLRQEESTEPFYEEEVTEEILPGLNWRAEGRVQRPVLVRGGIIADEVGYGKTAITLGLIDSARDVPKPPGGSCEKLIPTKATLVIVPGHLMGQWPDEVKKFLGASKRVVCLEDMKSIGNATIGAIVNADIVIVSFRVLCNETYFKRLARLVGINPDSFPNGGKGGRLFDTVYSQCLSLLPDRASHLKDDCNSVYEAIETDARNLVNEANNGHVRLDGKKAIYKTDPTTSKGKLKALTVEKNERNPWCLSSKMSSYERMKSPPLEAFFWNRIVVDEFTYLVDTERERVLSLLLGLKSSFRWCLSGTPQHANFNDIKTLANLLGLHLGVDETLPGKKLSLGRGQRAAEKTGLENLSQFLEIRSMQWHERRHRIAQTFLDRFVRQNVAEISEIPSEEPLYRLELPPAERAIYLELETHLKSLDMNSKNAQKSKKKSRGDRDSRMQKILCGAQTAEEALLKACTHFDMDKNAKNAAEKICDVIRIRKSEIKRLEREIIEGVASSYRQHHCILGLQPDWNDARKVEKGEVASALNAYLSEVAESRSVSHGADEDVHDRLRTLAQLGEAAFKTNPKQQDTIFEAVNQEYFGAAKKKLPTLENLYPMKRALHNYMFTIRSYGKELCGRVRSLRFVEHVFALQEPSRKFRCTSCNKENLSVNEVAILTSCGHFGCLACLESHASEGKCIEHPRCSADVSSAHVISSKRLNLQVPDSSGRYGCKLSAVVNKVKEVVASGDRVLVFSQFDDLKDKVAEALEENDLTVIQVKGSVKQQVKSLSVFQKEKPSPSDPRILLLKMDDEQSAGLNLTNLNHAVFVHPLLAGSQQQYDAYETQAIGRIRRYGQKKTVYVHRFLVEDTIDTEIYSERGGRNLKDTTGVV